MTKTEQAYLDYVKNNLLPVLEGYISDEPNPETIKKMEDELVAMLESHLIVHNWEVIVD